jgi:hypothetical protein
VFAATTLSKIVNAITQTEDIEDLPETPEDITKKLAILANRFQKISVTPNDLIYKFGQAIMESSVVI